ALLQWQRGDDGADPVTRLLEHCFPFRPAGVLSLVTMADGLVSPPAPRLRPPVIPTQIGRDREQPCAHIRAVAKAPMRPIRAEERLLGEIIRVARTAGHPREVPMYLSMVGGHHGLERLICHHSTHETPRGSRCEMGPSDPATSSSDQLVTS